MQERKHQKILTAPTPEWIEGFSKTLAERGKPRYTAQGMFALCARAIGYRVNARNYREACTACKPFIEALVLEGVISFQYRQGLTSYYKVPCVPSSGTGAVAPRTGVYENSWHASTDSLHSQAGALLAQAVFTPNLKVLENAEEQLREGRVFHNDVWLDKADYKPTKKDDLVYSDLLVTQMHQCASIRALAETFPTGFSFNVKTDDRGRFYYRGGYASPHFGKLNRAIYTHEGQVTLDHRTSFAQNFSLLTGSPIGQHCGVGSAEPVDFWVGMLRPYGVDIKADSIERKIAKAYGMVGFYGAGSDTCKADADRVARDALATGKLSETRYRELLEALAKVGESLSDFGERTRSFARQWVDIGEQPRWTLPTGFEASKDYWCHLDCEWNSGTNEAWAYPVSMTTRLETRRICERQNDEKGDKSVLVATTANILQSIDSAVLALAVLEFHGRTGYAPYCIHDSYTVRTEDEKTLLSCVVNAMRKVCDSPELARLRRELSLPPVKAIFGRRKPDPKARNLSLIDMNPLEREN